MNKSTSSRLRRLGLFLFLQFVLIALFWIFHVPIFSAVGQFLDISSPPIRTDYVYVLGGNPETRGFIASSLLRKGFVQQALLAPVKPSQDQKDGIALPESEKIRRVLVGRGTPPNKIRLLPAEVNSTLDEVKAINAFIKENPKASITVVTNDFHTRRARMLFRRILGDQFICLHFVSAPTDGFGPESWWKSERGIVQYINEYAKLIMYSVSRSRSEAG